MDLLISLASVGGGYLLGSISFTRIVSRMVARDVDVENIEIPMAGSDKKYHFSSMGATTASVALGPRVGCAISILDMLKAAIPTLVLRLLYPGDYYCLMTSAAVLAGHNWPVFYRFKGGRGASPIYGSMLVLDWLGAFAVALGGMALGFIILRDFAMAYVAGIWLIAPWFWFRTHDWVYVAYALVMNAFFMISMLPDFRAIAESRKLGPVDTRAMMEATPMGKGMLKMSDWLRRDRGKRSP